MPYGGWVVESVLKLNHSSYLSGMERVSSSTSAAEIRLARLRGEITAQEAAWLRYGQSINRAKEAQIQMYNTAAAYGFAALAAGIGYAADEAARLQRTLLAIKNETGAGPAAMNGFYNTTFDIANSMGVKPSEASEVMLTISRLTAGQLTTAQMQAMAPHVADVASMIHFNRPDVSVEQAAGAALALVHQFRAYTPKEMDPLMDRMYRLSGLMREGPDEAIRQMAYYTPLFKGLKIDNDTSIAMMALLDRAGFRNKVGTNVRAEMMEALGPLQMTKKFEEGKGSILEQMGVFHNGRFAFNRPDGGVDYFGMMTRIAKWSETQEKLGVPMSEVAKTLIGVFGKQGGTIATLMADPQMMLGGKRNDGTYAPGILQQIRDYLKDPSVSIEAGKRNRDSSLSYQWGRASSNLVAVFTELGARSLWVSGSLKWLADELHDFQRWMHQHESAGNVIAGLFGGMTAFLGTVAVVGAAAQALKFLGVITEIPNAFALTLSPMRLLLTATTGLGGAANNAALTVGILRTGLIALFTNPVVAAALTVLGTTSFTNRNGSDANRQIIDNYGYDYWRYLHGRHPGDPTIHEDDTMPGPFNARRLLQKQGSKRNLGSGGFGSQPATQIHVQKITFEIRDATDPHKIAQVVADLFANPQHLLAAGAPGAFGSANLPIIYNVKPA